MNKTQLERDRRYKQRNKDKDLVMVHVYVPKKRADELKGIAKAMREGA